MALTVEKLLSDARTLISRLKEQDANADSIMSTSQVLHKRIEAMKQYQDDITELNEMAKHRPRSSLVMGIAQENRQIRELQQEKQELQMAVEEHQSALQLIMHKYRQHTVHLLHANRLDATIAHRQVRSKEEVCRLLVKVEEMATVMQQAIRLDDQHSSRTQERITHLEQENQTLRQLLEICTLPTPSTHPHTSYPLAADSTTQASPSLDDSTCSQLSQVEVVVGKEQGEGGVDGEGGEEKGSKPDSDSRTSSKS
ncbi:FGFR1 oncogene partner 2 homolog [Babylonia areolata]|uniref:FGFR1 oncogene partner 2 homolog n=1 Tax=Babylonia areolata TaxID=304850 RepID=UPI003FD22CD4